MLRITIGTCFLMLYSCAHNFAQNTNVRSGFTDLNGYYDTREFSAFTINSLINFNDRLQYFSFVNYESPIKGQSTDVDNFYSEQNLRWEFNKKTPLKLTYQLVIRTGEHNDMSRLGLLWNVNKTKPFSSFFDKIGLKLFINAHLLEIRTNQLHIFTQLEYVYRWNILKEKINNRLYLAAFADQNIIRDSDGQIENKWVTEHQMGLRLIDYFYVVLEYRHKAFAQLGNKNGLGYGLEYVMKF